MLNNKDRVTCSTNKRLEDKVFTVKLNPLEENIKLYQVSDQVIFNLDGQCIQTNQYHSLFRVGDRLKFLRPHNEVSKLKIKTIVK